MNTLFLSEFYQFENSVREEKKMVESWLQYKSEARKEDEMQKMHFF